MDCANVRENLRDIVRDRLSGPELERARQHLKDCPECRHELEAERLLDSALFEKMSSPTAPAALRKKLEHLVGVKAPAAPPPLRWRRRTTLLAPLAAAAMVLIGLFAGRTLSVNENVVVRLADDAVTDHLRVLSRLTPYDVVSSDTHQVKPWFEGRLDFAPVVPGDRGELRLLGGGVGYLLDRKAAVISYALKRHQLTLLAVPRSGLAAFDQAAPEGAPRALERRGFTAEIWAARDVGYVLVSDVSSDELSRLAAEFANETRQ